MGRFFISFHIFKFRLMTVANDRLDNDLSFLSGALNATYGNVNRWIQHRWSLRLLLHDSISFDISCAAHNRAAFGILLMIRMFDFRARKCWGDRSNGTSGVSFSCDGSFGAVGKLEIVSVVVDEESAGIVDVASVVVKSCCDCCRRELLIASSTSVAV